jgi:ethanolamine-phosphate phospho-lyase
MSLSKEEIIRLRQTYVTPSLSVHYSQFNPLHIVRGDGLYLIDETDQPYLDCINNIALVGHSHPRLVEAFTRQKTNPGGYQLLQDGTLVASRELWERYRGKILGTLPGGNYDTILFTRSGYIISLL